MTHRHGQPASCPGQGRVAHQPGAHGQCQPDGTGALPPEQTQHERRQQHGREMFAHGKGRTRQAGDSAQLGHEGNRGHHRQHGPSCDRDHPCLAPGWMGHATPPRDGFPGRHCDVEPQAGQGQGRNGQATRPQGRVGLHVAGGCQGQESTEHCRQDALRRVLDRRPQGSQGVKKACCSGQHQAPACSGDHDRHRAAAARRHRRKGSDSGQSTGRERASPEGRPGPAKVGQGQAGQPERQRPETVEPQRRVPAPERAQRQPAAQPQEPDQHTGGLQAHRRLIERCRHAAGRPGTHGCWR